LAVFSRMHLPVSKFKHIAQRPLIAGKSTMLTKNTKFRIIILGTRVPPW
jgi:hypothetical protein